LSFWHARTLLEATRALDAGQAAKVEKRVLPRAGEQTVANFRRCVNRAVARVDTRRVEDKHRDAAADRRVVLCPERDDMASLYAYLPAPDAIRVMARLATAADQAKGDERTTEQRRADALVDLIADTGTGCGAGKGGRAAVQITVSLETLTGRSDEPGELAGYGALPARIAAELVHTLACEPGTRIRTVPLDQHRQAVAPAGIDAPATYRPGARLREFHHHPRPHLPLPRLPPPRRALRDRPHHRLRRHQHRPRQPALPVPPPPSPQRRSRLARRPHTGRVTCWITPTGRRYDKPPDEIPRDRTSGPPGETSRAA
jgi:Domain of unknown function (DUF222)